MTIPLLTGLAMVALQSPTMDKATEIALELQKTEELLRRTRGTYTVTTKLSSGPEAVAKVAFKFSGDWIVYEREDEDMTAITGMNSKYAFALVRNPNGYALSKWFPAGQIPEKFLRSLSLHRANPLLICAHGSELQPFGMLLASPDTKVDNLSEESDGLVTFTLTYGRPAPVKYPNPRPFVAHYKIITTGSWRIKERKLAFTDRLGAEGTPQAGHAICVAYHPQSFLPKSITTTLYNGSGLTETRIYDFTTIQEAQLPESDFTLSAFGLEEPHGVTWDKPTPYWLYGTLGSVAVIILGILLMRWAQRRAAKAAG